MLLNKKRTHKKKNTHNTTVPSRVVDFWMICFFKFLLFDAIFVISAQNGATQLQGELLTRLGCRVMIVLSFVSMDAKF